MRRRLGLTTAALLLALAAPAAAATSDLVLSDVVVDAGLRSVDLTVTGTAASAVDGLDASSLVATVDGRRLPTTSVVAASSEVASAPPRVLLVVDTSGSMQGAPLEQARRAINAFVAQAPAEVPLGLMAFSTTPRVLVEPTTDRSRVLGAVSGLQAQGETALYDAVVAGTKAVGGTTVGAAGDRRIVVLSDGGDTRSKASLAQALDAARTGVSVDAIGFNTDETVQGVLTKLAGAGKGRVFAASSSSELASALSTSVRRRVNALTVRVLVPEDVRGDQQLRVEVRSGRTALVASTPVEIGAPQTSGTSHSSSFSGRTALLAGLACIALSLLLGTLAMLRPEAADRRRTRAVLGRFTTVQSRVSSEAKTNGQVARTALELAGRVADKRDRKARTGARLERAAVAFNPAEWLLLQAGCALGLTLLLVLLGANLLVAVALGAVLGVLVPTKWLDIKGNRRQKAFEDKLPDALQMTAGSLSAGYSLAQALDGLVREGSEPMATEIGRALAESRLGVPVEKTLEGVAERMRSKDFGWVVMAVRVQREVGGNLAGVLTTVSATMRERAVLRRHVRGLSAEGRLSAYILVALPLLLALYMLTLKRTYIEPLYTTPLGWVFIAAGVTLLAAGSFVMNRMVKVEV